MRYKIENGRLVKIYPDMPNEVYQVLAQYDALNEGYAVLPEHLPIFEAMGTVEEGEFEVKEFYQDMNGGIHVHAFPNPDGRYKISYAIPKAKNEETKYLIDEAFTDNGEHSHWRLIDANTGDLVWTENPEEDEHTFGGFRKKNEDVWEEAETLSKELADKEYADPAVEDDVTGWWAYRFNYLKQHYTLTRKK